jgi:hypothetical protein
MATCSIHVREAWSLLQALANVKMYYLLSSQAGLLDRSASYGDSFSIASWRRKHIAQMCIYVSILHST